MSERPLLLCLSKDPAILEIRSRVLSTRYDVVSIGSVEEMKALSAGSSFDVLVLCHTLSLPEFNQAIELARTNWPGIEIVAVTTPWSLRSEQISTVVDSLGGPRQLFNSISALLDAQAHCHS